jgi:hypothetical protein
MMKLMTRLLVLSCISVGCSSNTPPANNQFDDDYMLRYATFLGECRRSLEATYGPAPAGSTQREKYLVVCDATWRQNNPAP